MTSMTVLSEDLFPTKICAGWVRALILVAAGVGALVLSAKVSIPLWPSPVPITLGTLVVLSIGSTYGPRLGVTTILAYLAIGALGFDVFAGSSSEKNGLVYMMGGTGGYLVGFALATILLGYFARLGWDRNVWRMAIAMFAGNVVIYLPGLVWLRTFATDWGQTLAWGLWPFLTGDAIKLMIAVILFPTLWSLVGKLRG